MHEVCVTLPLTALEDRLKNARMGSPRVRSAFCNHRFEDLEDDPRL